MQHCDLTASIQTQTWAGHHTSGLQIDCIFTAVNMTRSVMYSPPKETTAACSFPILCGIREEKSIRENTAACGVRKLMQPLEPQFVRLSLHNEQLRKSHTTTRTQAHIHTHTHTTLHRRHVIKRTEWSPTVNLSSLRQFSITFLASLFIR